MVDFIRRATMGSFVGMMALPRYVQALGERIAAEDPASMTPEQARAAYASIAKTLGTLVGAAREVQALENLVLGDPTTIISGDVGLSPDVTVAVSLEQVEAEVEAANRALARAKLLEASDDAERE